MGTEKAPHPVLILTWGNPSRGDDALGPALYEMLVKHKLESGELEEVDLFTDFQLQIEHAVDLEQREYVLFVDAGLTCAKPFEMQKLRAQRDDSYTTHAMSPAAVLSVYEQVNQKTAPSAYLMTIRAYKFGLGQDMSQQAGANLQLAFRHILTKPWRSATT